MAVHGNLGRLLPVTSRAGHEDAQFGAECSVDPSHLGNGQRRGVEDIADHDQTESQMEVPSRMHLAYHIQMEHPSLEQTYTSTYKEDILQQMDGVVLLELQPDAVLAHDQVLQ